MQTVPSIPVCQLSLTSMPRAFASICMTAAPTSVNGTFSPASVSACEYKIRFANQIRSAFFSTKMRSKIGVTVSSDAPKVTYKIDSDPGAFYDGDAAFAQGSVSRLRAGHMRAANVRTSRTSRVIRNVTPRSMLRILMRKNVAPECDRRCDPSKRPSSERTSMWPMSVV